MTHPLERLLIYTDKEYLNDFPLSRTEFNELYELYTTTKDDVLNPKISAVDFLNEVFFYLTCIYINLDCAEHLMEFYEAETVLYPSIEKYRNPQNSVDKTHAYEYYKEAEEAKYYIMGFVWFIINKQQQLPQHVIFFQKVLNKQFEKDKTPIANEIRSFMQDHPDQYNISFTPHPKYNNLSFIMRSNAEWQEVTCDFDRIEIIEIVRNFSKEDQKKIISLIKEAYLARKGSSDSQISAVTHKKRANENFLDNLAKDENLDELNAPTSSLDTQPQDSIIREGFDAYIIKEHKKVMDILMLVANMGNSQLAILVKFIKAFQQLGYIREDCFDDLKLFIENSSKQFNISIDTANIKKYIAQGTSINGLEYKKSVQQIAQYLQPLL